MKKLILGLYLSQILKTFHNIYLGKAPQTINKINLLMSKSEIY